MGFLDALMDEHRAFGAMLEVFDAIAARLGRGGDVPRAMLTDVLDFFDHFAARHHDKEEEVLFPLLAAHGIGSDQTAVNALLSQHEAGRMYGKKLRGEFHRLAAGEAGAAGALATDACAYIELIREHIRIEDEYFYALADRVLTDAEHASVAVQFELPPGDLRARAERQRYLRMIEVYQDLVAGWLSES